MDLLDIPVIKDENYAAQGDASAWRYVLHAFACGPGFRPAPHQMALERNVWGRGAAGFAEEHTSRPAISPSLPKSHGNLQLKKGQENLQRALKAVLPVAKKYLKSVKFYFCPSDKTEDMMNALDSVKTICRD